MATAAVMPYRDVSVSLGDVFRSLNPFSDGSLWTANNANSTPSGPSIGRLGLALSDALGILKPAGTPEQNAAQRANDNSQIQNAFFDLPGLGEIAPPINARQADAIAYESTFGTAPGLSASQNAANADYVRSYITGQNAAMTNNVLSEFTGLFKNTVFGGADPAQAGFPWVLVGLAVAALLLIEVTK